MTWAAGIDVGGTNLKATAVTHAGAVLQRVSRASGVHAASGIDWGEQARDALEQLQTAVGSRTEQIGVCAPGLVPRDGRRIAHLPGKLAGLEGIDWTSALKSTRVVPVLNDAHAALL